MDNLTMKKKERLLEECNDAILKVSVFHNDIIKMYAYIYDVAEGCNTLKDIKYLEIAKVSLDFLVRCVVK